MQIRRFTCTQQIFTQLLLEGIIQGSETQRIFLTLDLGGLIPIMALSFI